MSDASTTNVLKLGVAGHWRGKGFSDFLAGPRGLDAWCAVAIALFFSALYGAFAWRLTRGHFFEHDNLIFDYDSSSFVDLFAPPIGGSPSIDSVARTIKHPLASWLSVFSLPLRLFGVARLNAVQFANAGVGGVTVSLLFWFSRTVGTPRIEGVLIALIFGVGAAQLFSSMMVESYAYAALSLAVVWNLAALRIFDKKQLRGFSVAAYVLVFGVTITNIVQAAIAEFFAQWSHLRLHRALLGTVLVGAAVVGLAALTIALTWPHAISYAVAHPATAAREIYWLQTKGPKTGLSQVLLTFFGFSLAAPCFDQIALSEGLMMRDFRSLSLNLSALWGVLVWNSICVAGAVATLYSRRTRIMASALLLAIAFNIALHVWVQFRGSLFIYTPHLWFLIAALAALGAAAWDPKNPRSRWILRGALALVLVAITPSNIARAIEAAHLFDNPSAFTIPMK